MTPDAHQSDSVLIGGGGGEERKSTPNHQPTSTADVEVVGWLIDRGVAEKNATALVREFPADRVRAAVAWFDAQTNNVGPGLLVGAVRVGRSPRKPRSMQDEQREYGERIAAWLVENFPEFDRPVYGPHPAAVAAAIRLEYRDGKGSLSKTAHGGEIRTAVKAWKAKWGDD